MTRLFSAANVLAVPSGLAAVLAGRPPSAASGSGGPANATRTLADTVQLSPEARAKQGTAEETLAQLQQANRSMATDRKAAAKQKLDQAKARLQMLRMFAGDPRAMARQAKQIAQEIREAARAYGAAGAADAPAEATSAESASPAQTKAVAPDAPAAKAPTGEDPTPSAEEPRQQAADAYRAAAQDIASRGAKSQAEREEVEQFKDAARQARQLLQEAARRLRQESSGPAEIEEIEKVSRSMTRAVEDLSGPDATGAVPGAMPVLNVLA
jgi:hypothetical protein